MTVVATRPDATVQNGSGSSVTGAASRHAALNDNSDSSYVTPGVLNGETLIGFAEPSIPAGAVVKSLTLRLRTALDSGAAQLFGYALSPAGSPPPGAPPYTPALVTWSTPTTTTIATASVTAVTDLVLGLFGEYVRVYEAYADTTYVAKPTVNVTAPMGTVTDTNIPTVTFTPTLDSDGGAQTRRQVKIFTSAQYGAGGFDPSSSTATHDSGVQDSASASYALSTPLADATYRAYVRVGQTVNGTTHWSDWAYEGFVVNVTPPNAPSITATGEDDDGRIKIDLDDAASGPSTDLFEIEKSADGVTWESMRVLLDNGRVTPASGLATVYDYEAVNGVTTYYRARALHSYSGVHAASSWATDDGGWESPGWWLKHPTRPALNVQITVYSAPGYSRAARQGVFNVAGRNLPVVVDGVRGGKTGSLVLDVETAEERAAIEALLDEGVSLLLQGREDDNWEDIWVRFANQESSRQIDKAYVEATFESLPWTEVERPSGVIVEWPA